MSLTIALTDDIDTCRALRRAVFIEEQGVSEADEVDGRDGEALHLLARLDSTPVGSARLIQMGDTLKIGRVCVLAEHRGKGLGEAIMRAALDVGRKRAGLRRALLGSQTHAIPFYERLGFKAFGPEYDDAGIPHRDMDIIL